jgi:hypothetical protein
MFPALFWVLHSWLAPLYGRLYERGLRCIRSWRDVSFDLNAQFFRLSPIIPVELHKLPLHSCGLLEPAFALIVNIMGPSWCLFFFTAGTVRSSLIAPDTEHIISLGHVVASPSQLAQKATAGMQRGNYQYSAFAWHMPLRIACPLRVSIRLRAKGDNGALRWGCVHCAH